MKTYIDRKKNSFLKTRGVCITKITKEYLKNILTTILEIKYHVWEKNKNNKTELLEVKQDKRYELSFKIINYDNYYS